MLLAYANDELPEDSDRLRSKLTVRWLEEERERPRLIVKTELRFLAELVFKRQSPKLKETLKQDLQVLSKFLDILEDNRTKTQGSAIWHFTLTLWHKSAEQNLQEFQRQWAQRKSNAKPPEGQSSDRQQDIRAAQDFTLPKKSGSLFSRAGVMLEAGAVPPGSLPNAVPAQLHLNQTPSQAHPYSNLPARDYVTFIGRQQQLAQVLELLSFNSSVARISVEGIGGVGKTSLVLEAAHRCWQSSRNSGDAVAVSDAAAPSFDAIIFTSAKLQHFTPRGVLPRFKRERTLGQIFRAIARTLDFPGILTGDFDDQVDAVHTCLSRQRTLLIVDNLETIEEQEPILSFLYDLPATVKAILTSRDRTPATVSIQLGPLPEAERLQFIQHQAQLKTVRLNRDGVQAVSQGTGGIPAAMVYAMGQLADGYLAQDVLPHLKLASGDFCRFYLKGSVQPLSRQPAHLLLMALALFPQPALRDAVAQVALPAGDPADGLARLHQLSLAIQQEGRYDILPLTRDYALSELSAHAEFEQAARERWVNWSLQFAKRHGGQDCREWHQYDELDREWGNLYPAIEWCIEQGRYAEFCQFWQAVKGYTQLYGYWEERLSWMDWLLQAAQAREDAARIAEALFDKGRTLVLIDGPEQRKAGIALFQQIWHRCEAGDRVLQVNAAINLAEMYIHQQDCDRAQGWLKQGQTLLDALSSTSLSSVNSSCQQERIALRYFEAQLYLDAGECERAKALYTQALEQAEAIGWQRARIYIHSWLAMVAIATEDWAEAEQLLAIALPAAQHHHDKRCLAFCQQSRARIEHVRGNLEAARHWATLAKENFTQLKMSQQVTTTDRLLQDSSSQS